MTTKTKAERVKLLAAYVNDLAYHAEQLGVCKAKLAQLVDTVAELYDEIIINTSNPSDYEQDQD